MGARPLTALFNTLAVPRGGSLLLSAQPVSLGPLPQALEAYRDAGASLLVSLLPRHELAALGLQSLGAECERHAIAWAHCPIEDFSSPGPEFERAWSAISATVHSLLDAGDGLALHCRAGLGRTGTVAARILIERGMTVPQAILCVRQARPGAIETASQEAHLRGLASR